ncbi:MAG: hypothetical protein AAF962_13415 [Actinomycetota bacterium]
MGSSPQRPTGPPPTTAAALRITVFSGAPDANAFLATVRLALDDAPAQPDAIATLWPQSAVAPSEITAIELGTVAVGTHGPDSLLVTITSRTLTADRLDEVWARWVRPRLLPQPPAPPPTIATEKVLDLTGHRAPFAWPTDPAQGGDVGGPGSLRPPSGPGVGGPVWPTQSAGRPPPATIGSPTQPPGQPPPPGSGAPTQSGRRHPPPGQPYQAPPRTQDHTGQVPILRPSTPDPVDQLLARQLQDGRIAFNPPTAMAVGATEQFAVRIIRNTDLDQLLLDALPGTGRPHVESVETTGLMKVRASTSDGLRLTSLSEETQPVSSQRPTDWTFAVEATEHGRQYIWVSISATLPGQGPTGGSTLSLPVLHRTIEVAIGPGARIRGFVTDNWQWLIGTAVALSGAVLAWLSLLG